MCEELGLFVYVYVCVGQVVYVQLGQQVVYCNQWQLDEVGVLQLDVVVLGWQFEQVCCDYGGYELLYEIDIQVGEVCVQVQCCVLFMGWEVGVDVGYVIGEIGIVQVVQQGQYNYLFVRCGWVLDGFSDVGCGEQQVGCG